MVRFNNRNRPTEEQLAVWCEPNEDGFRLIRREPGGRVHTQRFPSRSTLYDATVRLQVELTESGWRPVVDAALPAGQQRAVRSGQFHR